MSYEIKEITTVPADPRPESIANVLFIVEIVGNAGVGHVEIKNHVFHGTVQEKLQRYREIFGKEWPGAAEKKFTHYTTRKTVSLNLGKQKKQTTNAQLKINALVELAKKWLKENTELKERRATQKTSEARLLVPTYQVN